MFVKVCLMFCFGGFDDFLQGWIGGWVCCVVIGVVYFDVEYMVFEGFYVWCKVWLLIGFYSFKGLDWVNMGCGLICGIFNFVCGMLDKDNLFEVQVCCCINGFGDFDGVEFIVCIDIGIDINGEDKNEICVVVMFDYCDYVVLMGVVVLQVFVVLVQGYVLQQFIMVIQFSQFVFVFGVVGWLSWVQ